MLSNGSKFASVLLVAALMFVAGCSMLTPQAAAGVVTLHSNEDNGASSYIGRIMYGFAPDPPVTPVIFSGAPKVMLFSDGQWNFQYVPAAGYVFLRWETQGGASASNPNSNPTTMTITSQAAVIRAIYGKAQEPAVGGVILPTNTYMILAPYLALIGLVATTAAIVVMKRRD